MTTNETAVSILAIVLTATVLLSPVACTMNRHRVIAAAIKAGADPIAAKCAIETDIERSALCITVVQRK